MIERLEQELEHLQDLAYDLLADGDRTTAGSIFMHVGAIRRILEDEGGYDDPDGGFNVEAVIRGKRMWYAGDGTLFEDDDKDVAEEYASGLMFSPSSVKLVYVTEVDVDE